MWERPPAAIILRLFRRQVANLQETDSPLYMHHVAMHDSFNRGSGLLRLHRRLSPALITICCAHRERLLADPSCAMSVLDTLHWLDLQRRCILYAAVVMPDHLHFVADPLGSTWTSVIHSLKGFTAHAINRQLKRQGPVWQAQYHDHQVVSDAQLAAAVRYCLLNPVRAGLVDCVGDWSFRWVRFEGG